MKTDLNQANGQIRVRLRTKFIISIIILECLLMAAITIVVENRMRESILGEFLKRGLSVAENLPRSIPATWQHTTMSILSRVSKRLRRATTSSMPPFFSSMGSRHIGGGGTSTENLK
jgi:hypothetical protein